MIKQKYLFVTITALASTLLPYHFTYLNDTVLSARHLIQSAYDRMDASAGKKDVAGAIAFDTPNYVRTNSKEAYSRLKQAAITRSFFASALSVHGWSKINSISIRGNVAVVVVSRLQEASFLDTSTKRVADIAVSTVSREIWLKERRGWLRASSKAMSELVRRKIQ